MDQTPEPPKKRGKRPSKAQRLIDQQTLAKALKSGKSHNELAKELGVHHTTISDRINRALTPEAIQGIINASRERIIKMIPRADEALLDTLDNKSDIAIGHRLKAATQIHKTFGLIQDEPQIKVQNLIPIQIVISEPSGDRTITIGPNTTAPEASSSVSKPE